MGRSRSILIAAAALAVVPASLFAQSVDVTSVGGIEIVSGGAVETVGNLESTGRLVVEGRIDVGGDLIVESGSFDLGEVSFAGCAGGDVVSILEARSVNGRVRLPESLPGVDSRTHARAGAWSVASMALFGDAPLTGDRAAAQSSLLEPSVDSLISLVRRARSRSRDPPSV